MRSLTHGRNRARLIAVLVAIVAMIGLSGAIAAPAQAATPCVASTGAKVCFNPDGEHLYVYDTAADGMAATAFYTFNDWDDDDWVRAENNGGAGSVLDWDLSLAENVLICFVATATERDVIITQSESSGYRSAGDGSHRGECPLLVW
ncbi:hypothetical protein [Glycomyces algeriensis]|uniref:Secreted protein n=1 Tax=Glycomyces algeriensis TaxID=256037 RepID=A0A9W6GC32_9ACTN|nr:hypothetical protein [Glycomyces algeriensis]MDA1365731.1 hypothetical protein [Glycomyces algeriensis]MDR7351420.1 hypothetical protein [Glycomyces algeriensis]GLI44140.1 hypothetical protein GALLR39Z86_39900 [Glycomyces algeriensis]